MRADRLGWARRFLDGPVSRLNPAVLLLPLALVVRLLGIVSRPIWYDEAFAVLFSAQGPAGMAYGTLAPDALGSAADIHPLGYYTLLWAWMETLGDAITTGRILSVLIGCAAFWVAIRLVQSLFGNRAAWWAGVFLALSPFHVHFSQEIRMYGLLAFFLIGATYFYWRALGLVPGRSLAHGTRNWALFSVFSAAAMYTHNLAAFYLAPLVLVPFWLPKLQTRLQAPKRRPSRQRRAADEPVAAGAHLLQNSAIRNTLLASAGAVVLYLPWLVRLPGQLAKVSTAYWTQPPGFDRLITTLINFTANLPISPAQLPLALLSTFLTFALALWQTIRAVLARQRPAGLVPGLALAYLAFVPTALMFVFSQFVPVYIERALLPSGIAYLLWVAWAFAETEMPRFVRTFAAAALLAGMFIGLQTHLTYTGFPYAPYADINSAIRDSLFRDSQAQAAIIHSNKLTALPAFLFDPELPHRYLPDLPGSGADTLALPTQEVIGFFASADIEGAAGEAERVFFIVFSREIDEYLAAGDVEHPQLAWLDEHFTWVGTERYADLAVYQYARP